MDRNDLIGLRTAGQLVAADIKGARLDRGMAEYCVVEESACLAVPEILPSAAAATPRFTVYPLTRANEALDDLQSGFVKGSLVLAI